MPDRTPPRRFKTTEEMTVADIIESQATGQPVETEAYIAYRRAALSDAGLDDDRRPLSDVDLLDDDTSIDEIDSTIRKAR